MFNRGQVRQVLSRPHWPLDQSWAPLVNIQKAMENGPFIVRCLIENGGDFPLCFHVYQRVFIWLRMNICKICGRLRTYAKLRVCHIPSLCLHKQTFWGMALDLGLKTMFFLGFCSHFLTEDIFPRSIDSIHALPKAIESYSVESPIQRWLKPGTFNCCQVSFPLEDGAFIIRTLLFLKPNLSFQMFSRRFRCHVPWNLKKSIPFIPSKLGPTVPRSPRPLKWRLKQRQQTEPGPGKIVLRAGYHTLGWGMLRVITIV